MMHMHSERFETRFATLFEQEGLMNVKFFVMNKNGVSLPDFLDEAASIQETIADNKFMAVDSIDGQIAQMRFDAAF